MKNKEFITYANSFQTVINLGLTRIEKLLNLCNNPQNSIKFIHIAGTNGKGSVCSFLQSILTKSNLKVGKFISPNMIRVNERITINNKEITNATLDKLLLQMKNFSDNGFSDDEDKPSQFEIWTAAALVYFKEENCDVVILETGLGGRFDATNIIPTPLLSIITKIDLDHTDFLGDTVAKIAYEKAGIIKEKGTTITLNQEKSAMDVLKNVALEKNNNFVVTKTPKIHEPTFLNERISYEGIENISLGISGFHQIENACLAIEAALYLKNIFTDISEKTIKDGLSSAKNIGRFELFSQNPTVIFDGAHNINGVTALKKSLDRYFPNEKKTYIMGFMKDKDIKESLEILKGGQFYFVKVKDNERAIDENELFDIAQKIGILGEACNTFETAYNKAISTGNMVIICGSLYLYKDYSEIKE